VDVVRSRHDGQRRDRGPSRRPAPRSARGAAGARPRILAAVSHERGSYGAPEAGQRRLQGLPRLRTRRLHESGHGAVREVPPEREETRAPGRRREEERLPRMPRLRAGSQGRDVHGLPLDDARWARRHPEPSIHGMYRLPHDACGAVHVRKGLHVVPRPTRNASRRACRLEGLRRLPCAAHARVRRCRHVRVVPRAAGWTEAGWTRGMRDVPRAARIRRGRSPRVLRMPWGQADTRSGQREGASELHELPHAARAGQRSGVVQALPRRRASLPRRARRLQRLSRGALGRRGGEGIALHGVSFQSRAGRHGGPQRRRGVRGMSQAA
jgi:hypothetical protein